MLHSQNANGRKHTVEYFNLQLIRGFLKCVMVGVQIKKKI